MTTADEQTDQGDQPTVQNTEDAAAAALAAAAAPQVDEELSPQQKAARTRAANKAKEENAPSPKDHAPADLRSDNRVSSTGGAHDKQAIVHLFEFDNGYSAKVYQRERGQEWEWAPMRNGDIIRNLPGLGRVPAQTTVAKINEGLALVAAIDV